MLNGFLRGAFLAAACLTCAAGAPLVLQDDGSFFVGGKQAHTDFTGIYPDGSPTEPGTMITGQTYVQYRIPAERNAMRLPLVLVHGGRHSGATYETTPDGREGWATYFVRHGFATYVVDAPGVGRSGFNGEAINRGRVEKKPELVSPVGIATIESAWITFRIGAKYPEKFSDTQFPLEAAETYFQQWVPSVGGSALSASWPAGLAAVLDKLGPSILFTHSASGGPGWQTVMLRPDKVQALVAIEPGNCAVSDSDLPKFRNTALLIVFGDHTEGTPWGERTIACKAFAAKLASSGGTAKVLMLPDIGFKGNTHMMMMDKNNDAVAGEIAKWIVATVR